MRGLFHRALGSPCPERTCRPLAELWGVPGGGSPRSRAAPAVTTFGVYLMRDWRRDVLHPRRGFDPMRIAAVLFDLDGTLIDSFTMITESLRHAARAVLGRTITGEETLGHWGEPLTARAAHLAPGRVNELIAAYTAYYDAHHEELCRPFAGIPEMLAALASLGCRQGVVTSKRRRSTVQALERCGLNAWIYAAVSAEDVPAPKPAPDPVVEALNRLGVARQETIMVGDAACDIEAARGAGVRTVAALWGTREREALLAARPTYVVVRPADVPVLVTSAESA